MFKSRNTKSANSPGSGNGTKKPIVELRECVTRMNSIVKTICASYYLGSGGGSKKGGKSGSPLKRSPSKSGASAAKINGSNGTKFGGRSNNINSQFIPFNPKQEEELIELLRRIAELVAQGEQRAAADADDASTSNSISPDVTESSNSGNAIFEYFCEANVLGTIVNIVTGAAFTTDDTNDEKTSKNDDDDDNTNDSGNDSENDNASNEKKPRHVLLPPIDLATQAIQSVSILMQNVARVTSLYFILSNNKVNDLINLPLDYYTLAEQHRNGGDVNSIINRQKAKKSRSAEMSELTTHFISFLKSLAMRMNPETLQFYLTYSLENKNDVNFNTIQFPLYARALEFCCADEDTFVRATAMNLCLNTLRLATTGEPLSTGGSRTLQESLGDERLNENDGNTDRPDKKLSPDGSSLHLNKALPFRERLAISHYVCMPAHVQALTSATFTKIGQLCGSLEERIRNMDRIDWTLKSSTAENENGNKQKELQIDRIQQVKQFHDLAADFQDEILLLADVLEVGLVPLNEQIIEMMFAGVVYPLVLQPLQLYTSPENANNKTKAKTNQVADVSLAKAAFFVIGYIYHFISHKPFLHLLLTALLHPLAPEASKSLIQTSAPAIVQIYENGDIQIKTDNQQNGTSLDCYRFGRKSEDLDQNQMSGTKLLSECTYVLSPALAQLYQAEMVPQTFKPNSYRRSILACLSGTDGMAVLQPLAIYAIDAALATIKPEILKNIIFGANIRPEWEINFSRSDDITDTSNSNKNATENYMVEVIASMCRSITTTSISPNGKLRCCETLKICLYYFSSTSTQLLFQYTTGLKSLSYNLVASHAICCTSLIDKPAKATALKLVEHRRRESASFMSQTPSRLTKHLKKIRKDQHSSKSSIDEDLKMDRIFFDPFCDGDKFAVENIVRRQDGNFWEGPAFISVAKDGGMHDLGKLICRDPSAIESAQTDEALYRCAANSAVAHLQVGKLM
jgi:hypothetical protein